MLLGKVPTFLNLILLLRGKIFVMLEINLRALTNYVNALALP